MNSCNCRILENTLAIKSSRNAFVANFEKLETSNENWAELFKCNICEQRWVVQVGAEMDREYNYAFKTEVPTLNAFDFQKANFDLEAHKHGGFSNDICMFLGCEQKALKGIAFCPKHKL